MLAVGAASLALLGAAAVLPLLAELRAIAKLLGPFDIRLLLVRLGGGGGVFDEEGADGADGTGGGA